MWKKKLVSWLCTVSMCFTMIPANAVLGAETDSGVDAADLIPDIAWWTMDETEGQTAADSTDNKFDADVYGGTWEFGQIGGALEFNGTSDFAIVKDYTKPSSTVTYSAWVYVDEYTTFGTVVRNWGNGSNYGQVQLGLDKDTGTLQGYISQSDGKTISVIDSVQLAKQKWTHVALSMDGENVTLYKDGKAVASKAYDGTLKTDFSVLGIGCKPNSDAVSVDKDVPGYLDGKLDDIRIYSRGLEAEEIEALYEYGLPTSLTVVTMPAKTVYGFSETIDTEGMVLEAAYADGSRREIPVSKCQISELDSSVAGKQEITVTYENQTAVFEVTVDENIRTLDSIKATRPLKKTTYRPGADLNLLGLEITAYFNDGMSVVLDDSQYVVSGFDGNKMGEQEATVSYTIGGVTKSVALRVKVEATSMPLKVREATEWTEMWDRRPTTKDWTNSDGIYSFNLNGKDVIGSADENTKTLFIYSDSNLGTVNDKTLQKSGRQVNHTASVFDGNTPNGENMEFTFGSRGDGSTSNIFGNRKIWLMDGVVYNNSFYVVGMITNSAWRVSQLDLFKVPIEDGEPNFSKYEVAWSNMPFLSYQGEYSIVFGNGILNNTVEAGADPDSADGYIYMYGYRMGNNYDSRMLASRVPADKFESFDVADWEFWDGMQWQSDIEKLHNPEAVICEESVSNEMSVTYIPTGIYAGKYMAVYMPGSQRHTVTYSIGDSPIGPFGEGVALFDCPEELEYKNRTYTYNAKAHPHLSKEGTLLVSYNVNGPWSTNEVYRSRWLEIDLNELADKPVTQNVSAHKKATASGYTGSNEPRFGADGGYWKNWWIDDTPGDKWIQIDLGSTFYVDRYLLRNASWGSSKNPSENTRDWSVQVSMDGEEWITVDTVTGNTGALVPRKFEQTPARYVRLYITTPTQNNIDVATVASFDVYGTTVPVSDTRVNVALGKDVTVSGGQGSAAKLVDGKYSSRDNDKWCDTQTKGDKWAIVDLGGEYEISKYILRNAGVAETTIYNTNDFRIEYSSSPDGPWTVADDVYYNLHSVVEHEVTPFTARYVRLYITDAAVASSNNADDVVRVFELELYSDTEPDAGWWKLNETEGTVAADSTQNGNNGNVSGAVWTEGLFDNCLEFDGKDDIVIVPNYNKPSDAATYSAWVYADCITQYGTVMKNWGEKKSGQISLGLLKNTPVMAVSFQTADNKIVTVNDTADFPTGEWVLVTAVADGENAILYINGQETARTPYSGSLKTEGCDFLGIGAKPNDAGTALVGVAPGLWDGKIDDVRIYSRALTPAEIKYLYGEITGYEPLDTISVACGTELSDVELPKTVTATLSNGLTRELPVKWDTDSLKLDEIGSCILTGTFGDGETCQITIKVRGDYRVPNIAWWKFDETDGTVAADSTENGFDGAVTGAVWETGRYGNGLHFDGQDDIVIVPNYTKPTAAATYSAWVYADSITQYGTVVKNWGDKLNGQIHFGLLKNDPYMAVNFLMEDGTNIGVQDSKAFPVKEWVLVTAVADGENVILYINDQEVARKAYTGTLKSEGYDCLGIGAKPNDAGTAMVGSAPGVWDGRIDDVRIYSWDLTAEEIGALYAEKPELHKEELQKLYDDNKDKANDGYTEESWEVFQSALTEAKDALDSASTQEEIDDAMQALEAAIDGLDKAPVVTELPYEDVEKEDWYYQAAYYNYVNKIMTGLDKTHFGPGESLLRAEFTAVLYRMNGEPEVEYEDIFKDVLDGEWYTDAILWANSTEVITGYPDTGLFGTADNITREQMAVMMYRYAQYKEYDVSKKADFTGFADGEKVSEFAKDAMEWAVGTGIISGKSDGTILDPQGNATRAECAAIIMRFMETYK